MQLKSDRRKRGTAIINVTSLIDVVLLLLIFFMLTTRFVQQPGMKLELPEAKSAKATDKTENTIVMNADGQIFLNEELVDISELDFKLPALIDSSSTENTLVLKADRSITHGSVIKVMDLAQLAGFQKLIIATEKE